MRPLQISAETAQKLSKSLNLPIEQIMHMPQHILIAKLAELEKQENNGRKGVMFMGFYIGGGIIVLFIIIWIVCYNSLVKYQNWVEESWYQIKNQLKRRYDLVPNLVSTVKGYTKHEQETLERVIQLRNQGATSEQSPENHAPRPVGWC